MSLEDIARCVELPLATAEEPACEEPHEQTENGIAAQTPNSLNATTDVKTIFWGYYCYNSIFDPRSYFAGKAFENNFSYKLM